MIPEECSCEFGCFLRVVYMYGVSGGAHACGVDMEVGVQLSGVGLLYCGLWESYLGLLEKHFNLLSHLPS